MVWWCGSRLAGRMVSWYDNRQPASKASSTCIRQVVQMGSCCGPPVRRTVVAVVDENNYGLILGKAVEVGMHDPRKVAADKAARYTRRHETRAYETAHSPNRDVAALDCKDRELDLGTCRTRRKKTACLRRTSGSGCHNLAVRGHVREEPSHDQGEVRHHNDQAGPFHHTNPRRMNHVHKEQSRDLEEERRRNRYRCH